MIFCIYKAVQPGIEGKGKPLIEPFKQLNLIKPIGLNAIIGFRWSHKNISGVSKVFREQLFSLTKLRRDSKQVIWFFMSTSKLKHVQHIFELIDAARENRQIQ